MESISKLSSVYKKPCKKIPANIFKHITRLIRQIIGLCPIIGIFTLMAYDIICIVPQLAVKKTASAAKRCFAGSTPPPLP